ncbi:hypothetical protein MTP99_013429 [Tenebrio molitor]|jgi:hypothetical protein|uniref:uncharacterized protein n=1 Tax=Tenebrio molitor TaxID=7067 RepID=UPI0026FBC727|nr:hypothetical protein MTP99_013429 [Tenebrio molitor]
MARAICVAIFVLFTCQTSYSFTSYGWREYTGEVPEDAIVGGKDSNGTGIYIGQAYVRNMGLVVVQITPGVREVFAPIHGVEKIDKYIKILCGLQQNVYWMSSDPSNIHSDLIDKEAVVGGHEDDWGYTSIGRINYQGDINIGKINTFSIEEAYLFFINNGTEQEVTTSYEILMYDDKV